MAIKLNNTSIELIGALVRAGHARAKQIHDTKRMQDLDQAHVELGLGLVNEFKNQRKDDNERG